MKDKLYKFIDRYGVMGFIRLLVAPVTAIITTPFRMLQLLWSCRILAFGRWSEYSGFNPATGINNLFYWTRALNFDKYGRNGTSPSLGMGDFPLSAYFHFSLPSLYLYWRMNNVTILTGMFGWAFFHFLWLNVCNPVHVVLVVSLLIFSSTFYLLLDNQNYNVVGWLFFPIALYALHIGNWWLAALAWLLVSFGSFTGVFFGGLFSIIASCYSFNLYPIFAIFPAILKISTHFIPLISSGKLINSLHVRANAIGLNKIKSKYRRKINLFSPTIFNNFVYLLFLSVSIYVNSLSLLICFMIATVILSVLNSMSIFRFADIQSYNILMLSTASAILLSNFSWIVFLAYLILCNPPSLFLSFSGKKKVDSVPQRKPFHIQPLLNEIESFFSNIKKNKTILLCFDQPFGKYEKIFGGYRVILEAPFYIASKNEFRIFPDWNAVQITNFRGAPDFWGRSVTDVKRQLETWNADYAVIYQECGTEIDSKWEKAGFKILSFFSWAIFEDEFGDSPPYAGPTPDWWLLRYKDSDSSH